MCDRASEVPGCAAGGAVLYEGVLRTRAVEARGVARLVLWLSCAKGSRSGRRSCCAHHTRRVCGVAWGLARAATAWSRWDFELRLIR